MIWERNMFDHDFLSRIKQSTEVPQKNTVRNSNRKSRDHHLRRLVKFWFTKYILENVSKYRLDKKTLNGDIQPMRAIVQLRTIVRVSVYQFSKILFR